MGVDGDGGGTGHGAFGNITSLPTARLYRVPYDTQLGTVASEEFIDQSGDLAAYEVLHTIGGTLASPHVILDENTYQLLFEGEIDSVGPINTLMIYSAAVLVSKP